MSETSVHRPWWLFAALFLFLALLSIPYSHKAIDHRSAFVRWQSQVVQIEQRVDIAHDYNYPNPPVMALILFPFAKLPTWLAHVGISPQAGLTAAALAWFFLKAGLTVLVFWWVFRMVEGRGRPFAAWAMVVAVILSLRPIMSDLQHGNVNLFLLFVVVAALTAFNRGRDLLCGILLALAIACKVTPALFLPYFLWKRAWKALAGSVIGLALFLWPGALPAMFLGYEYNQRLLVSWYEDMVEPYVVAGKVTSEHNNQSLPGLVARLATHSPSFSVYIDNEYTPTHYDNLMDIGPVAARRLVQGGMALFVLLVVWTCRTPISPPLRRENWRLAAEFAIITLGMLLFSERTWKHHYVTLVLPIAVLCHRLAVCPLWKGLKTYLAGSLVVATILIAATSMALPEDRAPDKDLYSLFAKKAQVYGAFAAANLVLLGALAIVLVRPKQPSNIPWSLARTSTEKSTIPAQAGAA
jgi:hypothetical protein